MNKTTILALVLGVTAPLAAQASSSGPFSDAFAMEATAILADGQDYRFQDLNLSTDHVTFRADQLQIKGGQVAFKGGVLESVSEGKTPLKIGSGSFSDLATMEAVLLGKMCDVDHSGGALSSSAVSLQGVETEMKAWIDAESEADVQPFFMAAGEVDINGGTDEGTGCFLPAGAQIRNAWAQSPRTGAKALLPQMSLEVDQTHLRMKASGGRAVLGNGDRLADFDQLELDVSSSMVSSAALEDVLSEGAFVKGNVSVKGGYLSVKGLLGDVDASKAVPEVSGDGQLKFDLQARDINISLSGDVEGLAEGEAGISLALADHRTLEAMIGQSMFPDPMMLLSVVMLKDASMKYVDKGALSLVEAISGNSAMKAVERLEAKASSLPKPPTGLFDWMKGVVTTGVGHGILNPIEPVSGADIMMQMMMSPTSAASLLGAEGGFGKDSSSLR